MSDYSWGSNPFVWCLTFRRVDEPPSGKPVLFSGPMVRAILEGRKTQTRRVVMPQPVMSTLDDGGVHLWADDQKEIACPYGKPGDRLWVREAWGLWDRYMTRQESIDSGIPSAPHALDAENAPEYWKKRVIFRADGEPDPCNTWNWHPSIHMPKWASRITLELTDVRVQRVQEISEEDAAAESCEAMSITNNDIREALENPDDESLAFMVALGAGTITAKADFAMLWDSINGVRQPKKRKATA